MPALHDKVAETMRKKDKMLEEMREQHEVAVKKIDQLEMIIGQQGKSMFAATSATKSKQKWPEDLKQFCSTCTLCTLL